MDCLSAFHHFAEANGLQEILVTFNKLNELLQEIDLPEQTHFVTYERLRKATGHPLVQELFHTLDQKMKGELADVPCKRMNVLVSGAGPGGLRAAIEMALLGATVHVIEQREHFARNNVLLIWDFTINDLKKLAAKFFFKKLCSGDINHISIHQLQVILLKVALLVGVRLHAGVTYKQMTEPDDQTSWHVETEPQVDVLKNMAFDTLIAADGEHSKSIPEFGFQVKTLQHGTSIGITANFINHNSQEEIKLNEFSLIRYARKDMFDELKEKYDLDLENLVYYRDETHYFVMTPKKGCLLRKGVFKQDIPDLASLTDRTNVHHELLKKLAHEVANFIQLPSGREFAKNVISQEEDVSLFDFSKKHKCTEAAKVIDKNGKRLIVCIVGDALVAPFWPQGTGANRAFLSALDTAHFLRLISKGNQIEDCLNKREESFKLSQNSMPNTLKEGNQGLDPMSRYLTVLTFN